MDVKKRITFLSVALVATLALGGFAWHHQNTVVNSEAAQVSKTSNSSSQESSSSSVKVSSSSSSQQQSNNQNDTIKPTPSYRMYNGQKVVDWYKPTGAHPDLTKVPANQLKLVVDKASQTLTVYQDNKPVSKMLVSTGMATNQDNTTPSGTFQIQPEHGKWFYNAKKGVEEGAWNWISFKDHGVYLFHSVPCDKQQHPIAYKMGKLGHRNSHGCVQMSFPDNQWLYNNFANKVGTQVVIK